ncbi:MAG: tRNA (N(6)-L-threonylcarbamoyladenosine(37)-C(2))-methylthiotransferase MtaB [Oscillospiraceae bacterium]|nr:tRNA (N(6)-L-threonylcarbamoyladenosine(37)-C(2))-methylthiotransferase MtaB [Oscillospiraceae bacterium]
MRIAICTLGCKVNQYETAALERELIERGHSLVEFEQEADAYIVNTCSVTAVSDKKSRQMIRRARKNNPAALVAVCGCYAQTHAEEAKSLEPDLLMGTNDRTQFLTLLEKAAAEKTAIVQMDDALRRRSFEILPAGGMASRTRAMLKVEDGCHNFCTYCIIPYARGPVRSLPMEEAAKQVRALREEGYREIVITGIEISSYGHDFKDGTELIDLLELLAREAGEMRLRFGSLEPRTVTEDFCRRAAKLPNLCPHFHLSMQSGCDATLKRMNRKYDTARFYESVELLRRYFDDPAITTDLITGFPEESEEEFGETLAFIEKCAFADMHVFPYSIRPGTKAAAMRQIEMGVREERAARAGAAAKRMHEAYLNRCVGKIFPVLFERDRSGMSVGHAPNYMEVSVPEEGLHNKVKLVRILAVEGGVLRGELVEEAR